jgi:phosphoribosylformylglycinamidine synthase
LEKGFYGDMGFDVTNITSLRNDAFYFGEAQGRVVATCSNEQLSSFIAAALEAVISCTGLGRVTTGGIKVNGENWGSISKWKELYDTAIEKHLDKSIKSEEALEMY